MRVKIKNFTRRKRRTTLVTVVIVVRTDLKTCAPIKIILYNRLTTVRPTSSHERPVTCAAHKFCTIRGGGGGSLMTSGAATNGPKKILIQRSCDVGTKQLQRSSNNNNSVQRKNSGDGWRAPGRRVCVPRTENGTHTHVLYP